MESEKQREPALAYGYVIADEDGRVQLNTLRSNRSKCWKAFIGDAPAKDRREMKQFGFRCVPVWVRQAKEASKWQG